MRRPIGLAFVIIFFAFEITHAQRYTASDGRLRVALAKQPFSPTGTSLGPDTMANGGIQTTSRRNGRNAARRGSSAHSRGINGVWRVETVPNGPSSAQLAKLFEEIFSRYPKASAIGFATIPGRDEGGLSLAAVNRMIAGAIRGVKARERQRR